MALSKFLILRCLAQRGLEGRRALIEPRCDLITPSRAGVLLGHKKLDTTALYTRVAISTIGQVTSPLDFLRKMPG